MKPNPEQETGESAENTVRRTISMKLNPSQVIVESAGHTFKTLLVSLTGDQQIDVLRESPGAWALVQANRGLALRRGDTVTVMSADGLVKVDSMTVTRALEGSVWLGKPLRIVALEPDILFEDKAHSVVPVGTGYSIKHARSGQTEAKVFASVAAAKVELSRRQPVAV